MEALDAMRPFSPAEENEGVFRDVAPRCSLALKYFGEQGSAAER